MPKWSLYSAKGISATDTLQVICQGSDVALNKSKFIIIIIIIIIIIKWFREGVWLLIFYIFSNQTVDTYITVLEREKTESAIFSYGIMFSLSLFVFFCVCGWEMSDAKP